MSDLFDTTQVRDEPEHWDALAKRVAATAARESRRSGFGWLANSRAGWIAAAVLVAGALAFIMLPTEDESPTSQVPGWAQSLAPTDDVGRENSIRRGTRCSRMCAQRWIQRNKRSLVSSDRTKS